ncbi:hyaluronan and proteoglycan link protein 1a [Denticeps clupeoides]|uniref:Hyaluronan and proteoglycan link protein 1-like n=1 Tax=Denticeps clupeoides TaxID=299321 RepID=A0AAY4CC61_9TELE|nr:hyaluronan and proteoglycan link protein 1-like [Denticeps clupeoides]
MMPLIALTLLILGVATAVPTSDDNLVMFTIFTTHGSNISLPCTLTRHSGFSTGMRIKWTKFSRDKTMETDVLVSMGFHNMVYDSYQNRAFLREADEDDATLIITNVGLDDFGWYKCDVIDGMDDNTVLFSVELDGVVFPYFPRLGRYNLNFQDAQRACQEQGASVATFEQLYEAWRSGMDWCNAGWLSDGTVQYPINNPREPCGGEQNSAGLRNYGYQQKSSSFYDVFCFNPQLNGRFYWLDQPDKLTFDEAVEACRNDGAEIAKVSHIFAAWKMQRYDRCDAGWLADGSVRYPISNPRNKCSPTEAAVRFVGFPNKKHKLYGVYCYRA